MEEEGGEALEVKITRPITTAEGQCAVMLLIDIEGRRRSGVCVWVWVLLSL